MKNELNSQGVFLSDIFVLNYYGIKVFFQVCKTQSDYVCVYELATKEQRINGEPVITLTKNLEPSKTPYFVPSEDNCYSRSNYRVYPTSDFVIKLEVPYDSRIYNDAIKAGKDFPAFGTVYAHKIDEVSKYYWEKKERSFQA